MVIALDSFKGSITASDASDAVARGISASRPELEVVCLPIADGGEGTVAAALAAGYKPQTCVVRGPLGSKVRATFALREQRAVIELAEAAGLHLIDEVSSRTARRASTFGVGQLIAAAAAAGAERITIGLGGSCTSDGGVGLLQALGARLLDTRGRPVKGGPESICQASSLDLTKLNALHGISFVAASDVTIPLLGPNGAAATFAPQKGASPGDVRHLENTLSRWADLVAAALGVDHRDLPGAGAAGGTGFALSAVLGAEMLSGADLLLDEVAFNTHLGKDTVVIVGEGSLDAQTTWGKGPWKAARRASDHGSRVIAVAGRSTLTPDELRASGISHVATLAALEPNVSRSMVNASQLLRSIGSSLAERL